MEHAYATTRSFRPKDWEKNAAEKQQEEHAQRRAALSEISDTDLEEKVHVRHGLHYVYVRGGERCIRPAEPSDAPRLCEIYSHYVSNTAISFEVEPPSATEMEDRMAETLSTHPFIVLEDRGKVMGYAYANAYHSRLAYQWTTAWSIYVDKDAHRCGYGRALAASMFHLLRLQGFFTVFALLALPNDSSVRFHEGLGFELMGIDRCVGHKYNQWVDVARYAVALQEYTNGEKAPEPPLLWPEARRHKRFQSSLLAGLFHGLSASDFFPRSAV